MYLLADRYGFLVSLFFILLSIGVSDVRKDAGASVIDSSQIHEESSLAIAEIHAPLDTCPPKQRLNTTLNHEAAAIATPPSKDKQGSSKDTIIGALRLTGGVLSLVILLLPLLCVWSYGNLENTFRLYSKVNLGCTALSCYGWLAYSVLQISFKDYQEIKGVDAIIINGFSWGFIGLLLLIVLLCAWEVKGMVCLVGLIVHIVLTIVILQFPIFRWVEKESRAKLVIGIMAGFCQNLAELIPIFKLVYMWWVDAPVGGYPNIPNFKKFIIIFRGFDSIAQLYWMLYCVFTYEFGISSIVCGALSLISLCAHSAWAVKPRGQDLNDLGHQQV